MNYFLIFLTGLTSGGVACAAMQGGLLASVIASCKKRELESNSPNTKPNSFDLGDYGPVSAFLATKWLSHIILGLFLGLLGSVFTLSLPLKLLFQGFAAFFMLVTAANLLDLHPVFRYFTITPPKFAYKWIKTLSSRGDQVTLNLLFAPALLGILTIFIPCGVTQAMAIVAINTGSPIQGALIMGSFVAGTIPIFLLIGLATTKFSELWRTYFLRFAAILLIGMGLYSLNGIVTVVTPAFSASNLGNTLIQFLPPYIETQVGSPASESTQDSKEQLLTIKVGNNGYSPNRLTAKVGVPVVLTLKTGTVYSCAASFTFRAFGISTYLQPNSEQVFRFTPTKKGTYTFSCSMGMYSGTLEII
jgi:uncharacterized protein